MGEEAKVVSVEQLWSNACSNKNRNQETPTTKKIGTTNLEALVAAVNTGYTDRSLTGDVGTLALTGIKKTDSVSDK